MNKNKKTINEDRQEKKERKKERKKTNEKKGYVNQSED